eukprot:gene28955-35915_t
MNSGIHTTDNQSETSAAIAKSLVNLGTTAYFAAIAYSTVTNSGSAVLNGDLGVYPGSAIVGFPLGIESSTVRLTWLIQQVWQLQVI